MLADLFPALNQPFSPISTDLSPKLSKLEDIRAIIFDIYGTLVLSGTGDISIAQSVDRESELRNILRSSGYSISEDDRLLDLFYHLIKADHERSKAKGAMYPEVDILDIWGHFIKNQFNSTSDPASLQELAIRFECAVNPVWPMPGLESMLKQIRALHYPLGIVSNAQFYTPLMLEGFTGKTISELGFEDDLSVWSFEERLGKPSIELFEKLSKALKQRGIKPTQALYVGNDMLNDIWTASQAGLKTALYAGDQRSLRLRESDDRCRELTPDIIVTELHQLLEVI